MGGPRSRSGIREIERCGSAAVLNRECGAAPGRGDAERHTPRIGGLPESCRRRVRCIRSPCLARRGRRGRVPGAGRSARPATRDAGAAAQTPPKSLAGPASPSPHFPCLLRRGARRRLDRIPRARAPRSGEAHACRTHRVRASPPGARTGLAPLCRPVSCRASPVAPCRPLRPRVLPAGPVEWESPERRVGKPTTESAPFLNASRCMARLGRRKEKPLRYDDSRPL